MPDFTDTNALINALSCAIMVLHPDGKKITYVNETTETLLGSSAAALIRKNIDQLLPADFTSLLSDRLTSDGLHPFTYRDAHIKSSSGKDLIADIRVTEWASGHSHKGNQSERLYVLIELQPLDRLSIVSRNTQLAYQQTAIKELSRNLAHEIKNPLGGILGAAQLLARQLPEEDQELTDIIVRESTRLQRLVEDMLGPNQPMNIASINIHQLLDQLISLTNAENSAIEIIRDYDPSIPDIDADFDRLNIVFINLLNNAREAAISHTKKPTIRLTTRIERQFTLHRHRHKMVLRVSIADNGAGIPAELRPQVFLPTITSKPNGNGLGLAMAQTISYQHGGIIDCEQTAQEAGETVFSVYLPLTQTANESMVA